MRNEEWEIKKDEKKRKKKKRKKEVKRSGEAVSTRSKQAVAVESKRWSGGEVVVVVEVVEVVEVSRTGRKTWYQLFFFFFLVGDRVGATCGGCRAVHGMECGGDPVDAPHCAFFSSSDSLIHKYAQLSKTKFRLNTLYFGSTFSRMLYTSCREHILLWA